MYTHKSMIVSHLTEEQHKQTCGYWFTVQAGGLPHVAFRTREGLYRWMRERRLVLAGLLEQGSWCRIIGEYQTASHLVDADRFPTFAGERSITMSNGHYVEAILEKGEDGIITVHTLNPNVPDRKTFDPADCRRLDY